MFLGGPQKERGEASIRQASNQTEASRGVMSEGARGARKPLIDDRTVSSLFDDVDSLVEAVLNRL
jgi:hypothetical protein